MEFSLTPHAFHLFPLTEQLHTVHDDEGFETDLSKFDGFFQVVGCANDKAIVWKILEQALVQLDVDQRVMMPSKKTSQSVAT